MDNEIETNCADVAIFTMAHPRPHPLKLALLVIAIAAALVLIYDATGSGPHIQAGARSLTAFILQGKTNPVQISNYQHKLYRVSAYSHPVDRSHTLQDPKYFEALPEQGEQVRSQA